MATHARTTYDRLGVALLVIATAVGVLLGLNGPATSPVSPGAPPVPVVAGLIDRLPGLPGGLAGDGPGPGRGPR